MSDTTFNGSAANINRLDRALIIAAIAHAKKDRKGTRIPYIMHPVHVAWILDRLGYPEETVIAGLLHDVLEDTNYDDAETWDRFRNTFPEYFSGSHQPSIFRVLLERLIEQSFGENVMALVRHASEQKTDVTGKKLPWRLRKEQQLERLRDVKTSREAVALKAADTLHNLRSVIRDVREQGTAALQRFNAAPEDQFWFLAHTVTLLSHRLGSGNSLAAELENALATYVSVLPERESALLKSEIEKAMREECSTTSPEGNLRPREKRSRANGAGSGNVYLLNSPILTGYGEWRLEPLTVEEARELVRDGFVSVIGHTASAHFLEAQLGAAVPVNRVAIEMQPGDRAIVLRLKGRLPEGKVLTEEEMKEMPFELGLLTRM